MFYLLLTIWWLIGAVIIIRISKRDNDPILIKDILKFIILSFFGLLVAVIDNEIRNKTIEKFLNKRIF